MYSLRHVYVASRPPDWAALTISFTMQARLRLSVNRAWHLWQSIRTPLIRIHSQPIALKKVNGIAANSMKALIHPFPSAGHRTWCNYDQRDRLLDAD